MLAQHLHSFSLGVGNLDLQRHLAGKRVGCATEARIVGPECHLNHVEQSFGHDRPAGDQAFSRLLDRHTDRSVIVGRAHDQVDFGQHSALVGPVMMGERAARRFHDSNALAWRLRWHGVEIVARDLRIGGQFNPAFGGIKQLDQPRPVCGQLLMDRLPAERLVEPLVLRLR